MKGTAYLLQATLILLWWLGLSISEEFFQVFQFPQISSKAFNAFFIPDVVVITCLSLFRAHKPIKELEYIILGGFAYGSLYCLNATILTNGGYISTTIMFLGLFYNIFLVYQKQIFRESKPNSIATNVLKTIIQIICVWTITLVFFPWIIVEAFGIEKNPVHTQFVIAIVLFIVSSSLGLYSAYNLVTKGDGTPLPADQTRKLVISGPYKFVRNPMAVAGMGQGLAVSIYFGSVHLLIYTLLGGLIWHIAVRPLEEKNMTRRFGKAYEEYKKEVRCWLPKI